MRDDVTTVERSSTDRPPTPPRAARFRPDVQALRAVAILAVVANHLWPTRLTGGYVGVDVFFVISGFLITSHLAREHAETGRIALAAFYARRIRRLLPAALLVLAAGAVGTILLLPYPRWERAGSEIIASAGYVENWFLSAMSVDYSAINDQATIAQHYWSLSVEEQFYLVWPVLLIGAWWWALRRSARPARTAAVVLGVVVLASFGTSVVLTTSMPEQAYFVTVTRAWEFGVGGLIALLGTRRLPRSIADLVAIAGLVAIVASAALFDSDTPFPGAAALVPVLGTAAVIVAGVGHARLGHSVITATRPVQWIGDVSYSLYLWHWPLIVLVPFAVGAEMSTIMRIGILGAAFLLAWATFRLVERPGQRWRLLHGRPRRSLIAMLAGMVVVALLGGGLIAAGRAQADADVPPESVEIQACVGPQAMESGADCADAFGPARDVVMGSGNAYFATPPECAADPALLPFGDRTATVVCDFGGGTDAPRVWLVGDSHAQQWQGALFDLARERGWIVTTTFGGGCPVLDAPYVGFRTPWTAAERERCTDWSTAVQEAVREERPDAVFTSSAGSVELVDDGTGRPQQEQFVDGLLRTWRAWSADGIPVIALGGVPYNGEVRSPDCLLVNARDPLACAVPVDEALPADPYLAAAAAAADPGIRAFDAHAYFCDQEVCPASIGGVAVFYDADHLNLDYVRRFAPMLGALLDEGSGRG
ncbi:acyltransferase family protein [Microbacterium sp. NPDC089696]|uniref:acyltransferase family protein n=1 Tax=Microbacterium sp. NPDC089696 TaxID=3364199 RepID=UPI00381D46BF